MLTVSSKIVLAALGTHGLISQLLSLKNTYFAKATITSAGSIRKISLRRPYPHMPERLGIKDVR
jgi:hypothetical protein